MVTSRSTHPFASAVAWPITCPSKVTSTGAPGWNPHAWTWIRSPGRPEFELRTRVAAALGAVEVVVVTQPEYGSHTAWAPTGAAGAANEVTKRSVASANRREK